MPLTIADFIRHLSDNGVFYSLLIPFLIFTDLQRAARTLFVLTTGMIIALWLKECFQWPLPDGNLANTYAFPSGHMHFMTLAVNWLLFEITQRTTWRIIPVLCLYGWSIIMMGYHSTIDVIAGFVLGYLHFFCARTALVHHKTHPTYLGLSILIVMMYTQCPSNAFSTVLLTTHLVSGIVLFGVTHLKTPVNYTQQRALLWMSAAATAGLLLPFWLALVLSVGLYTTLQAQQRAKFKHSIALIPILLMVFALFDVPHKELNHVLVALFYTLFVGSILLIKWLDRPMRKSLFSETTGPLSY